MEAVSYIEQLFLVLHLQQYLPFQDVSELLPFV